MIKEKIKIPGIVVRSFKQSEALISCKITMSLSDAKDLCDPLSSNGIDLRPLFNALIIQEMQKALKDGK